MCEIINFNNGKTIQSLLHWHAPSVARQPSVSCPGVICTPKLFIELLLAQTIRLLSLFAQQSYGSVWPWYKKSILLQMCSNEAPVFVTLLSSVVIDDSAVVNRSVIVDRSVTKMTKNGINLGKCKY